MSYSHATDSIHFAIGVIGNALSLGLFLSPVPTFARVIKKKSVLEYKYDPYVATLMNCLLWVLYGLPFIHPHSILVVTINATGILIQLVFLAVYFCYTDNRNKIQIALWIMLETAIVLALGVPVATLIGTYEGRSLVVGIFCVVFGIIMYGAPLTIMWKVIKTESVEYMPFLLSLASFLNGVCWSSYALIEFDLFVLIANGVGTFLGLAQLILYAIYWRKGRDKSLESKPSELGLSQV